MLLLLEVPLGPVAQGSVIQGCVRAELAGEQMAACQLQLQFSPHAFSGIQLAPDGFAQAGDDFDHTVDADGLCTIAALAAAPLTGSVVLFSFTAQVDGLRGETYAIEASAPSATAPDLVPIAVEPVIAAILVASGTLGMATAAFPDAHAADYYAHRIVAEGGEPPYRFTLTGAAPTGLTLDERGMLSGVPVAAASATLQVTVADAAVPAATASAALAIRVTEPRPRITTPGLPDAAPGHAYSVVVAASGGLAPLQWTATGLPPGLQMQNARIHGTVDPAAALGAYAIHIEVQDADATAQRDARTMILNVQPVGIVQVIDVPAPGAVLVARDLHVAEYDIEVSGSASSTHRDDETADILGRALEDVMAEIFDLVFEDGTIPGRGESWWPERPGDPADPGEPGNPFPGEPGEEPEPPGPRHPNPNRERLHELLQLYRWLDDQVDPNIIKFGVMVTVEIDGRHAYTWSNVDLSRVRRGSRPVHARRAPTTRSVAFGSDLRRHKDLWIRYAAGEMRSAMHKRGRKKPPSTMAPWQGPTRELFDARLERLLDAIDGRDWGFWIDPPAATVALTPGRHRVRLTPAILWSLSGDSITGAMEVASAQASMRATFRARNPHGWPRLDGRLVVEGLCRRSEFLEEDVLFPNSALDVVCESGGVLQIMPATGDPASPFGAPQAFAPALGIVPERLAAGAVDEFGRTWLAASDGDSIVIARNQGIGGFARLTPPSIHDGSDVVQQIQMVGTGKWGAIAVLLRQQVAVLFRLHRAELDPPESLSVVTLERACRSSVVHDEAAAFVVHRQGARSAFVVANRYSGQITRGPVKLAPPEVPATFLPAFAALALQSVPVALALDESGDETLGVVAFRQTRQLAWFRLDAGVGPALPPPAIVNQVTLPAAPAGLAAGPGNGLTILMDPAGQLLYYDAASGRLSLVFAAGGASAISAGGSVLAVSRAASNRVIIFQDLR